MLFKRQVSSVGIVMRYQVGRGKVAEAKNEAYTSTSPNIFMA
jgi:hypothetical protein